MQHRRSFFLLLALATFVCAVWTYTLVVSPSQRTLDQRVYDVASQLKCPVCQSESVADSSADIAQQMRQVIRQQLQAGKSEQDVLHYFESRYGSQILLAPPKQGFTLIAWLTPVALLILGLGLVIFVVYDWRKHGRMPEESKETNVSPGQDDLAEFADYRAQLEQDLANEDILFRQPGTEIN
jgi:cytochrome c-type biogenesis protein CcmH